MLLYFPVEVRPAIAALWTVDEAMASIVATATQPALAAIKLAWWREALERLDYEHAPAEPRLRAVADELISRGVNGNDVAAIESGWSALLVETPDTEHVPERGQALFSIEAKLLGQPGGSLASAARAFALGDARRRGLGDFYADIELVRALLRQKRMPRGLRPITLATRLALRDPAEPEGVPSRAFALLRHRLSGRFV